MVKKVQPAGSGSESGFTLIEVMIAMTILTVGLLSIAVAQVTAMKVSSRSKHLQDAMFLAREQMDTLMAIPNPTDAAIPSFFENAQVIDDPGNPLQIGNDPSDGTRYTRQTQIIPGQPSAMLARVIVTVVWTNSNVNGAQQVQLTSVRRIR